jgi:hypothetical protein
MNDAIFSPRLMHTTEWATILFVLCFVLLAVVRTVFEKRFFEFSRLIVSDKYVKVYKDGSHLLSGFNMLLFIIQVISLAFFIQISLAHFGFASKTDWIMYVRIFTLTGVFILSKFLIDKIIATVFGIEEFAEQFNLRKVSYRNYVSLFLLPVNIILFYYNSNTDVLFYACLIAVLAINTITYLISLRNYQNFIVSKLFYFILYLCALEIAPYYFIYYWFTKH